jgi:transposase InsO family protein
LGQLPVTTRRNKYILVIGDHFTKWIEAYPLPNQEDETVARKIVSEFVCRYGAFRQFHTDTGTNFESNVVKEVCKILGIQKTSTTPYHPQSDGMIERYNRTLNSSIAMMVKKNQKDWDLKLPFAMFAYRSSVHGMIKQTPYYMCFGHEVKLPIDVMFGSPEEDQHEVSEFTSKLRHDLETVVQDARENMATQHRIQKRLYDQRAYGTIYEVGNFVWFYNPRRKKGITTKFACNWTGPYMVVKRLSDTVYRIQRNRAAKPKVVHYDRLKRYRGDKAQAWEPVNIVPNVDVNDDVDTETQFLNDTNVKPQDKIVGETSQSTKNERQKRNAKRPDQLIEQE